jgi:hypothetical protein
MGYSGRDEMVARSMHARGTTHEYFDVERDWNIIARRTERARAFVRRTSEL